MAGVHVNKYAGKGQYSSQGSKYARKRGQRVVVKRTPQDHRVLALMRARGITLPEAQAELTSLRKEQALQTVREKTEGWRKESGLNSSQNGGKG